VVAGVVGDGTRGEEWGGLLLFKVISFGARGTIGGGGGCGWWMSGRRGGQRSVWTQKREMEKIG